MTGATPRPPARATRATRGLVLLAGAMAGLLAGLWGALDRLGFPVPAGNASLNHGPLMVLAFLGTMVSLERAAALGRRWGWLAPLCAAAGGVVLIARGPVLLAQLLFAVSGFALLAVYDAVHRLQSSLHNNLMALGAGGLVVGVAVWMATGRLDLTVPWSLVLLVATIVAERLEMSRAVGAMARTQQQLAAAVVALAVGAAVGVFLPRAGALLIGLSLLAMAVWLVVHDAARRTVRTRGLTRFMAVALLAGYAWMAVGGLCWVAAGLIDATWGYDLRTHAVFLGFVMSMIFAHAPIIGPALTRRPMAYHPVFYGHLGLLHASLAVRLVAAEVAPGGPVWRWAGLLNEVAVVWFLVATVVAVIVGRRRRGRGRQVVRRLTTR